RHADRPGRGRADPRRRNPAPVASAHAGTDRAALDPAAGLAAGRGQRRFRETDIQAAGQSLRPVELAGIRTCGPAGGSARGAAVIRPGHVAVILAAALLLAGMMLTNPDYNSIVRPFVSHAGPGESGATRLIEGRLTGWHTADAIAFSDYSG